ncbi:hypothetical protein A1F94_005488 [Pyrenophora tritici-repentis]|nr:hypothetical protein PtrV1_08447 [Pyrenophora tritici-repentis]KAF7449481.1 hypothetical protein A1F99_065300 [Pyrenophora tritici-repentis]KAG9383577.1 hypothetical protein A1F94_005488 [Pyrenophora tritici-repentis]KAI1524738.1 RpsA Ribosomal protein S1 [Pyrenophora tritici-repentis]KAI1525113.1 RpsA Ribosomal protein S1 [Pyrenophora tritici-repentis]
MRFRNQTSDAVSKVNKDGSGSSFIGNEFVHLAFDDLASLDVLNTKEWLIKYLLLQGKLEDPVQGIISDDTCLVCRVKLELAGFL